MTLTTTNTPDKIILIAQTPDEDFPVKVRHNTTVNYWWHAPFCTFGPYAKPVRDDFHKNGFWTKTTRNETVVEENVHFA